MSPEHQTDSSKVKITQLCSLGEALGYHVERERALPSPGGTAPRVDIAWMLDADAEHPLFVFEVESAAARVWVRSANGEDGQTYGQPAQILHVYLRFGIWVRAPHACTGREACATMSG